MSSIDRLAEELMRVRAADLTVEELVTAASSPLPVVRAVAARHPSTPKDTLLSLVDDEDSEVVVSLTHNLSSYRQLTTALLQLGDDEVRAHTLACSTPNVALFEPAANGDYDDAWHLVKNIELDPRMLSRLFSRAMAGEFGVCQDSELLALLTLHPNTPTDIRWTIAEMDQVGLNFYLARSVFTPPEVLRLLAQDENATVRSLARLNPCLPDDAQLELVSTGDVDAALFRALMEMGDHYDPEVLPLP